LTREDIGDYRARLTDRDLAVSTLNQTRAIVRGIFALAVERYDLEDDVSIAFKRAKTRRATSEKISFYPPEEVMRLVANAANEQDTALFLTATFTGLRASELRGLRWRSVDFAGSLLHVERGFTDEGGEDLPKSYRVRSVPLMPQVALALSGLRGREYFTDDDELEFVNEVGAYSATTRSSAATGPRKRTPESAGCASTACATASAPWPCVSSRSPTSRPGRATPTSPPPANTSTTHPNPSPPPASGRSSANSLGRSQRCAASADRRAGRATEPASCIGSRSLALRRC
jgi:Phage integrase family